MYNFEQFLCNYDHMVVDLFWQLPNNHIIIKSADFLPMSGKR